MNPLVYLIENGVAIAASIHRAFHAKYSTGLNTPNQFEEFCRENYNISSFPWRQGNHKPSLSIIQEQEKIIHLSQEKANEFAKIVQGRKHKILEGSYVDNKSVFKIYCLKHEKTHEVIAGNYKRSRLGISCCAREKQGVATAETNRNRKR